MPFELAKTPVTGRAQAIRDGALNKDVLREAYEGGKNLSRYLESLDPTSEHTGSGAQTDAFNRVLAACGIHTRSVPEMGIGASTLEDIVRHPQAQFLATEIFARAFRGVVHGKRFTVQAGEGVAGSLVNQFVFPPARDVLLQPAIPLSEVVGQTTGINASHYKPFYLDDVSHTTSRVGEGAEIPAVKIATHDKTVNLVKFGRRLDITYEANRRIPIDLLSFYVTRIAIAVEADKVDKALSVLINGDGNTNTAATSYNLTTLDSGTSANVLTLKAWLALKMKYKNPLMLTTVLAQDASVLSLMLLNSGSANIPLVLLGPQFSGLGVTPINQGLRDGARVGWLDSAPSGKLVTFDKRLALERVFEIGSPIQETEKDVISQINSLVLSEVEGYGIIDQKATKILNLAA